MKALFVGRFQPLHKGHLYAMKKILENFDELIVVIGSINKKNGENPFSFEERKRMIKLALGKLMQKTKIIGIPDVFDDEEWVKSIERKADFDIIITGNEWVKKCFEKKYRVIDTYWFKPEIYNSTKIREIMHRKGNWKEFVPDEIKDVI